MELTDLPILRRCSKICGTICTLLYLILSPFLFYMALLSSMIFAKPSMTIPVGLSIMALIFCIPLSMLISIYLIWSRYNRKEYKKSLLFCALPFSITIVVVIVSSMLQIIFL